MAVALPTALFAQSSDGDISRAPDGEVLHRRTRPPGEGPVADTPVFVYEPGATGGVPKDLVRDGLALPRPSASTDPAEGELIHTAEGLTKPPSETHPEPLPAPRPDEVDDPSAPFAPAPGASDDADAAAAIDGDASPTEDPREGLGSSARPDRATQREGTLHYAAVFDPSVVPFKRNRSLDGVGEDFSLRVSNGRMERVAPIGNRLERGREVFWGSVLLSGTTHQRIPIPSVSPEGRILTYQANPAQDITFERDLAGNFYATPALDGRLRLVFVTDAPGHWFGRSLPRDVGLDAVPRGLRPKVPKAVSREALEVARAIGIPRSADYAEALERLVAWFRAFEPGDPPPVVGSVYRDIALGQKGICRHRSHAFVITAQALGIPAHYVFNEAHVFVEVWVPGADPGWLRIDLGGGAEELDVHGGEGKSLHQPPGGDPFAKPPALTNAATARSMCSSVCAADSCTRIRAFPCGTTGKLNPIT